MITLQFCLLKLMTTSFPIPVLPPVITATFPDKFGLLPYKIYPLKYLCNTNATITMTETHNKQLPIQFIMFIIIISEIKYQIITLYFIDMNT
jgi:hypothetical protein